MSQYYFTDADFSSKGPFEVPDLLAHGVTEETLIWQEGMEDWMPAAKVPEVKRALDNRPIRSDDSKSASKGNLRAAPAGGRRMEAPTVLYGPPPSDILPPAPIYGPPPRDIPTPAPIPDAVMEASSPDSPCLPPEGAESEHQDVRTVPEKSQEGASESAEMFAPSKRKSSWWKTSLALFIFAVCLLAIFVLGVKLDSATSRAREAERQNRTLSERLDNIAVVYPLVITDVEIANVEKDGTVVTDYGGNIYSWETYYIRPRIKYEGLVAGDAVTIEMRFYTPSGTLSRGSASPDGCTLKEVTTIWQESGELEFLGWGSQNRGNWPAGTYRMEFWVGDVCLKTHTFKILGDLDTAL
ncbi:MAG: DUF4339 domain-containing protein [Alloprevotella sp.]|nr:DUF4339 domain-containing protein [Alloprevotella sp.]